ncbi:GAF domain-containing protein [Paraglaciecola aestuariivivens]
MPMQLKVSLESGWVAEHLLFEGNEYQIGRAKTADVLINHPQISRLHATLSSNDDQLWSLRDTSSVGCFRAGQRVKSLPIQGQQILQLGPISCQFNPINHHQLTVLDNQSVWRQQQIKQFSQQFSQCPSSAALLDMARHCLIQTLGCERAALILLDENQQVQQGLGFQAWMQQEDFSGSRTIIRRCIAKQAPQAIGNIKDEPILAAQQSVVRNNIQAALCVPVIAEQQVIAVLYADNTLERQFFTQTEVEFVQSFASILSLRLLFQSIGHNISLACNN